MSDLNGTLLHEMTIRLPAAGSWTADVVMQSGDTPPTGAAVLTSGSLVLHGTVKHSGLDVAGRPHALVVGGIGWDNLVISPLSFQSDAGVRLSTVLMAYAKAAGETLVQPTDVTIGQHYELIASRDSEPVRWLDALNDLVRAGYLTTWRVDPDGITRFTARASTEVTSRATPIRQDSAVGLFVFGIDDPGAFLPGNTISGLTINRIVVRETSGRFEADVYTTPEKSVPSIRDTIRQIAWDRLSTFLRTYVVDSVESDGRLNLAPPSDARHLPELARVEQWTTGGASVKATKGTEVLVVYRDQNCTRPVAVAFGTTKPENVYLDATNTVVLGDRDAAVGVARQSDTVTVLLPPATFSGTVNGLPATGIVVWATQTIGNISTASAKTRTS